MESLEGLWRQVTHEFDAAQARAGESARARVTGELNQLARRLKQYDAEAGWCDAVLDGSSHFASEVALFGLSEGKLVLKGVRNLPLPAGLCIPLDEAKALQSTIETGEPAIVLCTGNEVSEAVASAVSVDRGFVIPVAGESGTIAVLFAAADEKLDTNALELIAQVASAALRRPTQSAPPIQISGLRPLSPDAEPHEAKKNATPAWMSLPHPEMLLHVRAQRLARTRVAEMQLYRPEACKAGRAQSDIYLFLKQEIDGARNAFRSQFMSTTSMIDYLHCELLRQLAADDESILGADYPGQMA
jgi:hypothetical protein